MSFTSILGQERAVKQLKQALHRGKLHHAYLFCGLPGVGKEKTARELIKALNCDRPNGEGGCDRCPSCSQIERGIHPDYIHLRPEGTSIRIEQIRDLQQRLSFGPALGRCRLCLLDPASDLNEAAANAFLKTLEEPPPATYFVLLVQDPGELLPTVVSRCVSVTFHPLPLGVVEDKLVEERGVSREEAKALSLLSGGSLGKAFHYIHTEFRKKQELWFSRLEEMPQAGVKELLSWATSWTGSREEVQENLEIGAWCIRDLIWIRLGWADKVSVPSHWEGRVRDLAFSLSEEAWLQRLTFLHQAEAWHRKHVNARLNWEVLLFNLAGRG